MRCIERTGFAVAGLLTFTLASAPSCAWQERETVVTDEYGNIIYDDGHETVVIDEDEAIVYDDGHESMLIDEYEDIVYDDERETVVTDEDEDEDEDEEDIDFAEFPINSPR